MQWFKKILPEFNSERALITRAKRGDRDAFAGLYVRYVDGIYRYIYFRLNQDNEETKDIVSTVFLKAWKRLDTFTYHISFQAWVYRIAHNTLIDHYKTKKAYTRLDEIEIEVHPDDDEKLDIKIAFKNISKAMQSLTAEQKQIITLKFIEELTNKEIAFVMNKQEDAVRALQCRALKELRRKLKDKG